MKQQNSTNFADQAILFPFHMCEDPDCSVAVLEW